MTDHTEDADPEVAEADAPGGIDRATYRRRSRRSFLAFGAAGLGGYLGFRHIQNRPEDDNIPDVVRRGLEFNEAVWTAVGSETLEAPTYGLDEAEDLRVNGQLGLGDDFDPATWELRIVGVDGELIDVLDLEDVKAAGTTRDLVWEHKCIEGWAERAHWTGVRFRDLAARYYESAVPADTPYVSLRTPDEGYYVGLDREIAVHSQTLLAWGLGGEPLTLGHGAPLRLAMPITYGIKQLKRIGTIEFTDRRPDDYWAERGYDWHARF
jgi:DMSO/TMAO reductase YedYZ molybdopterin-dependent catalytic subunit